MTPIVAKKVIDDEVVTYSAYLASGNTQTCTAQGFIYILSLRLWNSYYAALMILYWFIVHYGWKENRMNIPRLTNVIHSATDHNRPWTCHPTHSFWECTTIQEGSYARCAISRMAVLDPMKWIANEVREELPIQTIVMGILSSAL